MKWLSSTILFARIRGMEIRFHISMIFSLPIAYYLFRPADIRQGVVAFSWLIGFILCILLHELGHAFTARLFGVEVKSVVIWLLGGFTNLSRKADQPSHNLAIFAAGPLVNMLLAFLSVIFYIIFYFLLFPAAKDMNFFLWVESFSNLFLSLALVNLVLIVFNLLPLYPLDGGNILHSIIEIFFGKANADLMTLLVSIPVLLILFAFGFFTRDYVLMFSCLLIALAVSTLNRASVRWANLGINYLFKRGGYYYLQEDYERAIQYYTRDIDREPQQPSHYLARAACLLNTMQLERAKADAQRALNLAPNHPLALQLRGEMFVLEKNYDRAFELFDRALQSTPNWAIPHFDRGSVFLDQKEYQSALVEINKSIALMPQFYLSYLIRSLIYFKIGNLESAHRDEEYSLHLSEKEALVMTDLNAPIYEGHLDWAEDYYARVIDQKPRLAYAYQGRADAYRVNGQHEKAVIDYTRAIELMPEEARLHLARGKSYRALNETEKAKSDFQAVSMLTTKLHLKRQADELLKNL